MSSIKTILSRTSYGVVIASLILATLPAILVSMQAKATGQVTSRYVKMSKSASGATGVQYEIGFTINDVAEYTASTLKGVIVDICENTNSPLVGDSCATPTSFNWGTPTISSANVAADNIAGWTTTSSDANTLILDNGTGITVANNDVATITVTGVANPSDVGTPNVGTFYARIITLDDNAGVGTYNPTNGVNTAGYAEIGGVAISTTNELTLSARIFERLTFCVDQNFGTDDDCTTGTSSSMNIPSSTTTPLNDTTIETNTAEFVLGSNATAGATVRLFADNDFDATGVLASAANDTINPFGFGADTDNACSTVGATSVEQFGLRISTAGSGFTASGLYGGAAGCYGWDTDNTAGAGNNDADTIGGTYGDPIGATSAPTANDTSVITFGAKAATDTEAGIYTTVLDFIATGVY